MYRQLVLYTEPLTPSKHVEVCKGRYIDYVALMAYKLRWWRTSGVQLIAKICRWKNADEKCQWGTLKFVGDACGYGTEMVYNGNGVHMTYDKTCRWRRVSWLCWCFDCSDRQNELYELHIALKIYRTKNTDRVITYIKIEL